MITLINISICLFFIILSGWTTITYLMKKDSQKLIREELSNLFEIFKKFFVSLKNLIKILTTESLSSEFKVTSPIKDSSLDENEKLLRMSNHVKEIEAPSLEVKNKEDDDIALSSFSPEVVEVIKEEEEKVA